MLPTALRPPGSVLCTPHGAAGDSLQACCLAGCFRQPTNQLPPYYPLNVCPTIELPPD
jgi:hypothetical protein